jgi:Protein of unknown function (DUF1822)
MNYSSIEGEGFAVPLPITKLARDISLQFAKEQPNSVKADRVRLNTLAVLAVKDYLKMMGIVTSLDSSDSWNRVMRLCADVADLEISNLGILECRPVRSSRQSCYIPAEVWQDRIGYLVVEINDDLQEAKILGFVQQVREEEVAISRLKSPEDFLDYLARLSLENQPRVSLSQWLEGIFDRAWQDIVSFSSLCEADVKWAFRGFNEFVLPPPSQGVRKAKLLVLERELLEHSLLLILSIRDDSNENLDSCNRELQISLQLHSLSQTYLPESLELQILDRLDDVFLEAKSRERDNYLQLDFQGNLGEFFSVKVTLGDREVREDFVV